MMDTMQWCQIVFMGCVIAGGAVLIEQQILVLKELQKQTCELQIVKNHIVNKIDLTNDRLRDVNLDLARHTILFKAIQEELRKLTAVVERKVGVI